MIYIFAGENVYMRGQQAESFIGAFRQQYGSLAIESLVGEELTNEKVVELVTAQPFLTKKRLVKIRSLASNKPALQKFVELYTSLPDNVDIVLVEDKLDARAKLTTKLKSIANYKEFSNPSELSLADWVVSTAKLNGAKIDKKTARYLAERVGFSQEKLSGELRKLSLYSNVIEKSTVDELTQAVATSSIFAMLDSLAAGRTGLALQLYAEQRSQGMEPHALLGMITWQLINMAMVRAGNGMSAQDIAAKSSLSPYVVSKTQGIVRHINKQKMLSMVTLALQTDLQLKTTKVDTDMAVKQLIVGLSN